MPVPVIVSNFNYFYHRGTDNDEQKDLKYSLPVDNFLPAAQTSSGSIKKSDAEDSIDAASYQNMMIIGDLNTSDIYSSPVMPSIFTQNLLESWSTNGGNSHTTDKSQSYKYHLVSNINNRATTFYKSANANINLNSVNIETDV